MDKYSFGIEWTEEQKQLRLLLQGVLWKHIWWNSDENMNHKRHGHIFKFRIGTFISVPAAALIVGKTYVVLRISRFPMPRYFNTVYRRYRDPHLSGDWYAVPVQRDTKTFFYLHHDRFVLNETE